MKKKKRKIAVICALSGVCILTTAALAGYSTDNGYEVFKDSVLKTMDYNNCTVNFDMSLNADGTDIMTCSEIREYDLPNCMSHTTTRSQMLGEDSPFIYESYRYDNKTYMSSSSSEPDIYISYDYYDSFEEGDNIWGIPSDSRHDADKFIRFMELAADTVVGDLKNNFICTESNDEYTEYSITLDSVQIPELVNSGLGIIFPAIANDAAPPYTDESKNNPEYYLSLMGEDPIVDSVSFTYSVDKEGNPLKGEMVTVFTGNGHSLTTTIKGSMSVGTTSITRLEDQGSLERITDEGGNVSYRLVKDN